MSLQPGMNPLEASSMEDDRKRLERTMAVRKFRQGMQDRANLYNEMKKRTGPGINPLDKFGTIGSREGSSPIDKFGTVYGPGKIPAAPGMGLGMAMTGGFDASDLMKNPEMVQKSTRDQAEKVSEPYREANMMAADKTNPMNAASQEPGKSFLMRYIGK